MMGRYFVIANKDDRSGYLVIDPDGLPVGLAMSFADAWKAACELQEPF